MKISLGKYTFRVEDGDYKIHVDRYTSIDWMVFSKGHGAIYSLMAEFIDMREQLRKYQAMAFKNPNL